MPGVQFGNQIDMNGFRVTEMGAGANPTDAVNLAQLTAASPQGFAQDVGDAVATSFNIDHNFGSLDVVVQVVRKSDGVTVFTDVTRSTVNRVIVDFGSVIALNSFRVLVVPVP